MAEEESIMFFILQETYKELSKIAKNKFLALLLAKPETFLIPGRRLDCEK